MKRVWIAVLMVTLALPEILRDFGVEPPKILMLRVHPDVRVRVKVVAQQES